MNLERYELYRSTVQAIPTLDGEDANSLAWRAWLGDWSSRQELIERHLWLVVELAERLRAGKNEAQARLVAEGNRVLVRAAEVYRPWRDGDFAGYARNLLTAEMAEEALPAA